VSGPGRCSTSAPRWRVGVPSWRFRGHRATALFLGRGAARRDGEEAGRLLPADVERAWLRQIHSAYAVNAVPGSCGQGDALVTDRAHLALIVASADCVPVLLATPRAVAAVHAGWRGVAAGVVAVAVRELLAGGAAPESAVAWIGPAIGRCCYEVGTDVAEAVAAASAPEVVEAGPRGRPHVDLGRAVALQLRAAGVRRITWLEHCTRCREEWLWSHRRDGEGAGRNLAAIWRDAAGVAGAGRDQP
jgi:YfiH family protein